MRLIRIILSALVIISIVFYGLIQLAKEKRKNELAAKVGQKSPY